MAKFDENRQYTVYDRESLAYQGSDEELAEKAWADAKLPTAFVTTSISFTLPISLAPEHKLPVTSKKRSWRRK